MMKVDKFAQKSLRKALKAKKKNYILIGLSNKLVLFIYKLIPKNVVLSFIYKYQTNRNK